jgi:hypothetical protein
MLRGKGEWGEREGKVARHCVLRESEVIFLL